MNTCSFQQRGRIPKANGDAVSHSFVITSQGFSLSKTDSHPIDHPYRSFVPLETVVEGEEDDVAESSSRPKNSKKRGKRKRKRYNKTKGKRKEDSEKKDAAKKCCAIS